MENNSLEAAIKEKARAMGFDACGIAKASVSFRADYVKQWLAEGKAGDMAWLAKNQERRLDPNQVLPGVKSVVVVALNYFSPSPISLAGCGKVARYARGEDYHKIMEVRLKELAGFIQSHAGGEMKYYVDTGPVLERETGMRAGLGWQGKSTMLISKDLGTWFFLGEILTTLDLQADVGMRDHCGNCQRCIKACPTAAITAPYQLDARRCIAYLTIENRGPIPEEFRKAIGDRIFGCDDCLEVCPWNRFAKNTREEKLKPLLSFSLQELLEFDEERFHYHFQRSPIKRIKLRGLQRNVCVALGNVGNKSDIALLEKKVLEKDELVAEHAKWAIQEIQRRLLI
ncbi:MAG: tRNA epoxyqueuosine(34) reductase QueG [Verrucomicrobiae bacterium]|nr:tRNA epoxyqueuosine(34) reductase QueG [Verrucomicrobiae bacterium]